MDIPAAISEGSATPAALIAASLLLGALHGLEPGHSKTMMAAFIIAARGTVGQAILLGLAAAVSHSAVVWVLALLALFYGNELIGEELEPVFALASGILIIGVAIWITLQTWVSQRRAGAGSASAHHHDHSPDDTHRHPHAHGHDHGNDPHHGRGPVHDDAHARAHAADIERHLAGGRATTWQTVLFGLSGGLIPCAAAIPILILCLHLGRFWLGIALVTAFSAGLALTLVVAGVAAAVGVRSVSAGMPPRLLGLLPHLPYLAAAVIAAIGAGMIVAHWEDLVHFG